MAITRITIDPVSRISGLLDITVEIENNAIVEAYSGGMQFRGFEEMLRGRPPLDMPYLTARTCGICSVHHALASTIALEEALGVIPSANGVVVREMANGFEVLQNNLRHFYQFVVPDYVNIEGISPIQKSNPSASDYRLPSEINNKIASNYFYSITMSRKAHKAVAILAGKAPHPHGIFVGGTTTNISSIQYSELLSIVSELKSFIEATVIPDMYTIAEYYNDYYNMGASYGNFIAEQFFSESSFPVQYSFGGVLINGERSTFHPELITEDVKYTWVNAPDNVISIDDSVTLPDPDKADAYSWVTAPRYNGYSVEVGPLARMYISGIYTRGISAMDRLVARILETARICDSLEGLLSILQLEETIQRQWQVPASAKGFSAVAASRGLLIHSLEIEDQLIKTYKLITPSNWNFSPKDNKNLHGAAEKALIGTTINDVSNPVEIGRIIRSFDPCLNCAAHVISDRYAPFKINIL